MSELPSFLLSDYDFDYPDSSVADRPADPRDSSRLLVLERASGALTHSVFREIGRWLGPGDCLVVNRSKVVPARLRGKKPGGGKAEILLVRELAPGLWSALANLKPGQEALLPEGERARVSEAPGGGLQVRLSVEDVRAYLARHGEVPLPPYILKRRGAAPPAPEDRDRYQTVYAREEGSIAAPTAGLHFTPELLASLRARGTLTAEVVLHVGPGTFVPLSCEDVRGHRMQAERFEVSAADLAVIEEARRRGRLIAVGTTATRALETLALRPGESSGETDLYIRPGHEFRRVSGLLTNFHQPRSTPLVLACAFAGRSRLLSAYREAIERGYRLFSYGDAMLIL